MGKKPSSEKSLVGKMRTPYTAPGISSMGMVMWQRGTSRLAMSRAVNPMFPLISSIMGIKDMTNPMANVEKKMER